MSLIYNIETSVKKSEQKCDNIRNRKFTQLLNHNNTYYIKSKLINMTEITIPEDIKGLLELGPNNPIGGYVRNEGSDIFLGLDALFNKVKSVARKNNVDELNIETLRCNIMLTGRSLSLCTTKDTRIEKFLQFKSEHPDLIFMKCDKSKNICLLKLNDYFVKLQNLFSNNSEFLKIQNFNLKQTMDDFKILLKTTINPSLSNRTQLSIKSQMSILTFYGTIKDHKPNFPLRPIGTAYDCLTLGAEEYISKLLEPLRKNCTYAINSQIKFKTEFLKFQPDFDPETQEIFTLDVNSLFSNINNTRTINYILNEVFIAPEKYFFEKDKKGVTLPVPSRESFANFFMVFSIILISLGATLVYLVK